MSTQKPDQRNRGTQGPLPADQKAESPAPPDAGAEARSATKPQPRNRQDYDPFLKKRLYSDPWAAFAFCPKPLREVKDTCFFVIDANTLLLPYAGTHTLQDIAGVYRKLVEQKRLVLPAQVLREFLHNRGTDIERTLRHWHDAVTTKMPSQSLNLNHPLLEGLEDYKRLGATYDKIRGQCKELVKAATAVEEHMRGWYLNDPISALYRSLFTAEVVRECKKSETDILADLDRRHVHNLPPGTKDKGKPDGGIGDVIIWHNILELGAAGKPTVFVSGDSTKGDWVYSAGDRILYPLQALVEEYRVASGGHGFYFIQLSDLLALFDVERDKVEEVKQLESQAAGSSPVIEGKIIAARHSRSRPMAVTEILEQRYPLGRLIASNDEALVCDMQEPDGAVAGVVTVGLSDDRTSNPRQAIPSLKYLHSRVPRDKYIVIMLCADQHYDYYKSIFPRPNEYPHFLDVGLVSYSLYHNAGGENPVYVLLRGFWPNEPFGSGSEDIRY